MRVVVFGIFILLNSPSEISAATTVEDLDVVSMMLKMMASLGIVIGLFLLMYALVQKIRGWLPGTDMQQLIKVVSVRNLGPKRTLYLVEVDGRRFFLAVTPDQVRLLSEWAERDIKYQPSEGVDMHANGGFAACIDELDSDAALKPLAADREQ